MRNAERRSEGSDISRREKFVILPPGVGATSPGWVRRSGGTYRRNIQRDAGNTAGRSVGIQCTPSHSGLWPQSEGLIIATKDSLSIDEEVIIATIDPLSIGEGLNIAPKDPLLISEELIVATTDPLSIGKGLIIATKHPLPIGEELTN